MFEWLEVTFADASDRARLVAILLSSIVAIFVLLLNQHFNTRKARKELLIKKIEEVYQSIISYEKCAHKLLKGINRGNRDENGNFVLDPSLIDLMNEEVEKLEMLVSLYFPKVKFNKSQYYAGPTLPVLEIAIKQKQVTEDVAIEASLRTMHNIQNNAGEIKKVFSELMEKYRH